MVKRNACVGVWEDIRGKEHCEADLFCNCQSIPGTFFLDAGIKEVGTFNNMFLQVQALQKFFWQMYF